MEFVETVKNSFRNAKRDLDVLRVSFVDWISFLHSNQKHMQRRIAALESRIRELESEKKVLIY